MSRVVVEFGVLVPLPDGVMGQLGKEQKISLTSGHSVTFIFMVPWLKLLQLLRLVKDTIFLIVVEMYMVMAMRFITEMGEP